MPVAHSCTRCEKGPSNLHAALCNTWQRGDQTLLMQAFLFDVYAYLNLILLQNIKEKKIFDGAISTLSFTVCCFVVILLL